MPFSFLNPWFWLGALVVAAPIWLHLRRKRETNLMEFTALRFLDDQPEPRRSPLRLRDIVLFMLRVLALLLLVAAFAWPYLRGANTAPIKESRVYILDNTLSHQANDGFVRDRDRILGEVTRGASDIQMAVIELTSAPRVVVSFGESREAAKQKLKALEPSFQRGSYLAAFRQANSLLGNSLGDEKRIILLGDNQENQWNDRVDTPAFLRNVQVDLPKITALALPNLSLSEPRVQRIFLGDKSLVNFTVKLGHAGAAKTANIVLRANEQVIFNRAVELEGQPETILLQAQWEADPASWLRGEVSVDGTPDALLGDNRVFFSLPPVIEGKVALLAQSPYLRLALSPEVMRGQWATRVLEPTKLAAELTASEDADVLVVESNYLQSGDARKLLWRYVTNGRGALVLVNRVTPSISGCLRELGFEAEGTVRTEKGSPERFLFVYSNHPIFHPFLSPDFGSLLDVKVSKYVQLEGNQAMPLIFSEKGAGLFFQGTKFPGKLFVAAFGLDREHTSWPIDQTFIPFLDLTLQTARAEDPTPTTFEPGEISKIQLPAGSTVKEAVLRDERRVQNRAPVEQGRTQVRMPDKPGVYMLTYDDSAQVAKMFSVNPSPKESQLSYVDAPEALKVWRVNLPPGTGKSAVVAARETEPERHLATALVVVDGDGRFGGVDAGDGVGRDETGTRMSFRFTVVETSLNRAEFRWKWLKFLQHSFLLGSILCALVLLFGGAMICGWITSKALATTVFALLGMVGFIAWAVIIISVMAGSPDRGWLAAALERVNPRLLDRLNTLLFLERHRRDARSSSFAMRIARQTQKVLAAKAVPKPFPSTRAMEYMLGFIVALTATVLVYQLYSPWSRLLAAEKAKATPPVQAEKPLELTLPTTNNAEQMKTWGEVRITDPGGDLRVTKVDVVPLQIEAAANQALKKVGWFSTINGAAETPHELPPPSEPRYAVYQPTVYMDELRLSDWDVMTYYAKANTEKENSFASDVYFLEVRPFREDILKMPGGENGQAYQSLNELSTLISRQQHVIRQTHQHLQKPQEQETLQAQDRKKLSDAEADLADSAQHLYAQMAARMENKPIGEALDNLAKAEKSLDRASKLLGDNVMNEAQNRERRALAELIAARKMFQKAVSDNPNEFADGDASGNNGDDSPTADALKKLNAKKLNEMAEFRNEAKATQQFVDKTLEQQRSLEQQTRGTPPTAYSRLGEQEQQLEKALADFEQLHPRPFKGTQAEAQQAQDAMTKAAESLEKKSLDARTSTQQATQQLEKLSEAMKNETAGQQLADAYKLKQMLDKQIQTFGKCANPGAGGQVSDGEVDRTASEARETLNQLKKVAEQEPTRDAFGPPLRTALNGTNKMELDSKLARVQLAQDEPTRQQRAGEAKDALSKVSKAFEESEPKAMQMAQKADSLIPGEQESFNQGMAELESLAKQLEEKRKLSPDSQAKQGQEALGNLQSGMRGLYGHNERATQLVLKLDQMLKGEQAVEVEDLRKLIAELQHFSLETADQMSKREDKPEVTNIDPTRLPPAYRGRIQKYFQRLSEK